MFCHFGILEGVILEEDSDKYLKQGWKIRRGKSVDE
jgi:hypothetical protein